MQESIRRKLPLALSLYNSVRQTKLPPKRAKNEELSRRANVDATSGGAGLEVRGFDIDLF